MIGFSQDLQGIINTNTEGPDTSHLQKNELYELVARDYFLAPSGSRGITREYLLAVREGRVFRVTNADWKCFEFRLERGQLRKTGMINNAILVRKLNLLLKSKGGKELGFSEYDIPEQNWLFKVARFIDQTNMLEFFEEPIENEPLPSQHSSPISKIYWGRLYAGEYLFEDEKKKSNKKLWQSLRVLSEAYRMLLGSRMHGEVLEHDLLETRKKILEQESSLQDLLSKVSFAYTSIDNPAITADLVINNQAQLTPEMRQQLSLSSQL